MLSQIILLPKKDYWNWVRACKDFVLAFGASMTRDPETAVRHMAPRQVITVVKTGEAYAEYGEILAMIERQHPGVRVDAIQAMTPGELKLVLEKRIQEGDQFGQGEIALALAWPTEFPIISQSFGSNPEIYAEYGFPGHEGVDFWTLMGSKIHACMDGEVYRVHEGGYSHPYGIHIGILHAGGYRTIYAHLMRADVVVGQQVKAGEAIGRADSTGFSGGNHLHLVLKHDGATERNETNYPKDVIDPTPYLVWPDNALTKTINRITWPAGKCLVGAHGRVGGTLESEDVEVIKASRLEAVKIHVKESERTIDQLRAINPGMLIMARIEGVNGGTPLGAKEFLEPIEEDIQRLYRCGVRQFELLSNPNLAGKGWPQTWRDGEQFGEWFVQLLERLKSKFGSARFGFPGLSMGNAVVGQRIGADDFLAGAADAAATADWIGVHCHWADRAGMRSQSGGLAFEEYRARFPNKLLMITEFANTSWSVRKDEKAKQYLDFLREVRHQPGIGAAFGFAISATQGYEAMAWRNGSETIGLIAKAIGERGF